MNEKNKKPTMHGFGKNISLVSLMRVSIKSKRGHFHDSRFANTMTQVKREAYDAGTLQRILQHGACAGFLLGIFLCKMVLCCIQQHSCFLQTQSCSASDPIIACIVRPSPHGGVLLLGKFFVG